MMVDNFFTLSLPLSLVGLSLIRQSRSAYVRRMTREAGMAKRSTPKKKPPKNPKPPPECKAMLLCQGAIIEQGTGNVSLINTFSGFLLRQIPGNAHPFTVFIQLIGGTGRYEIVAELHDLRHDKIIGRASGMAIDFKNRLHRINVMIPIPPVPLPHDGTYDLVILANNQVIEKQTFTATIARQPPPSEEQEHA